MVITNIKIVLLDKIINNGYVIIENGIISGIKEGKYPGNAEVFDGKSGILMPGFVDIHIHGSANIDFMNARTVDNYKIIEKSLLKEGVTTFLATTLTSDQKSLVEVAKTINIVKDEIPCLAGIHLEGPYISKQYKGAQNEKYIRNPDINELKELIDDSNSSIRVITMAPELENSEEFIKFAIKENITVSCGHSNADENVVKKFYESGLKNITHTSNGMNKNAGIVECAKKLELNCEFIADGKHVPKEVLTDYYKIIGPDRFMLVTDALRVKNSNVKEFELGGLPVEVKDDACYLKNGKLAGSILTMNTAIKNMKEWCGCSLNELAKISSKNPANSIGLYDIGEIKVGNKADLVLLDEEFNIKSVIKDGIRRI